MSANVSTSVVAATLGKYRLVAELGSGGMANVYLAVMQGRSGFNKLVVLKVPRDAVAKDPNALAMFLDEARIAARLSHPNIVQTFEVINEAERDILVMEYLDGYSLNDAIMSVRKSGGEVPMALQLRVLSEALNGLHYAHEAKDFDGSPLGFVHRDMTPHNVFLTFDGQVKLLDFGISKAAMQSHKTEYGVMKGKVRYMPLEQLAGGDVDRRADIFSVGMMLWEAATGQRLWHKKSDVEVMTAVIAGKIPMPRDVKPDVPEELEAIVKRAVAHQRDDRYATALDLKHDIDAFLARQPSNPTLRDVTSFLESTFVTRRANRRQIIDDKLKSLASTDGSGVVALSSNAPPPLGEVPVLPSFGPTESSGDAHPSGMSALGLSRSEMPPTPTRRRAWPLLLGLLLLLLGIGVVFGLPMLRKDHAPTVVQASPLPPPSTADLSPTSPPSAAVPVAIVPAVPSSSPAATSAPTAPRVAVASPVTRAPVVAARPIAPPPPATTAPTPEPPGTLSFTTTPWARVSEGGKVLGTTPLYKIPLSPGTHVLTLENGDEGLKTTYTITIKSGEAVTRSTALK